MRMGARRTVACFKGCHCSHVDNRTAYCQQSCCTDLHASCHTLGHCSTGSSSLLGLGDPAQTKPNSVVPGRSRQCERCTTQIAPLHTYKPRLWGLSGAARKYPVEEDHSFFTFEKHTLPSLVSMHATWKHLGTPQVAHDSVLAKNSVGVSYAQLALILQLQTVYRVLSLSWKMCVPPPFLGCPWSQC